MKDTNGSDIVPPHAEPAPLDGVPASVFTSMPPLPSELRAGKNTSVYNVHSYSTKVPYQAIAPFIGRFSKPGELVLDPFCGSGMTGVAAIIAGRRARLSDCVYRRS